MKASITIIAWWIALSLLNAGCSLLNSGSQRTSDPTITLTLDKADYSSGEAIQATLFLRNATNESLLVNKRMAVNLPSAPDAVREVSFLISGPSGQELPLNARINVRLPTEDDFSILSPGQTVQQTRELQSLYSFEESGQYSIYAVYQNMEDPPSGAEAWKGEITSNLVILTVH